MAECFLRRLFSSDRSRPLYRANCSNRVKSIAESRDPTTAGNAPARSGSALAHLYRVGATNRDAVSSCPAALIPYVRLVHQILLTLPGALGPAVAFRMPCL